VTKRQVEQLVTDWQQRLGLDRWKITHLWDVPAPKVTNAIINRSHQYDTASLRLARGWETWPEFKLETTIVHELLHLHFRDIDQSIEAVKGTLHPDAWTMVNARYEHEVEGLIDRLAHRLVEIAAA
jgi:hypothetical protein